MSAAGSVLLVVKRVIGQLIGSAYVCVAPSSAESRCGTRDSSLACAWGPYWTGNVGSCGVFLRLSMWVTRKMLACEAELAWRPKRNAVHTGYGGTVGLRVWCYGVCGMTQRFLCGQCGKMPVCEAKPAWRSNERRGLWLFVWAMWKMLGA